MRSLAQPKFLLLSALLLLSLALYVDLCRLDAVNGWRPVLHFLFDMAALFALYWVAYRMVRSEQPGSKTTMGLILLGAVLFRVALLPTGLPAFRDGNGLWSGLKTDLTGQGVSFERFLLFDCDVWRYLWDGYAWAHGHNPYQFAPDDPAMDDLANPDASLTTNSAPIWSEVRENIPYGHLRTVYPPAAQVLFRVSYALVPGSVLMMKILIVGLDLGAVILLIFGLRAGGLPSSRVILYAWNPLVIKVFAGSAHYDALVVLTLAALAFAILRGWRRIASVMLGLSILSKFAPIVLIPFLYRRTGWRGVALCTGVVLFGFGLLLPASQGLSGLSEFSRNWQFNAGPYALLQWTATVLRIPDAALFARAASAALVLCGLLALYRLDLRRDQNFALLGAWSLGGLLLLSPVVNPWYVTWILPFAVLSRRHEWLWMTAFVCLAFLVMVDGREYVWALFLEYGALLIVFVLAYRSQALTYDLYQKGAQYS